MFRRGQQERGKFSLKFLSAQCLKMCEQVLVTPECSGKTSGLTTQYCQAAQYYQLHEYKPADPVSTSVGSMQTTFITTVQDGPSSGSAVQSPIQSQAVPTSSGNDNGQSSDTGSSLGAVINPTGPLGSITSSACPFDGQLSMALVFLLGVGTLLL
jgi:hypothetical protein